jgi:hypothetical protein
MNLEFLFFILIGGMSGSIMYSALYDLYHIYITKQQYYSRNRYFNISLLTNPGLFLGFYLGYKRYVCGMPLIKYYL